MPPLSQPARPDAPLKSPPTGNCPALLCPPTGPQEDSTFTQHIIPFARRLSAIVAAAQPVPGCMPRTSSGSGSASSSSSAGGGIALGNSTRLASPGVQSFGGASNNRRLMRKE